MVSHLKVKKYLQITLAGLLTFTLMISQVAIAECAGFLDSDFPSNECSFNDFGVDGKMVKFGHVDSVFTPNNPAGSPTNVRFGSANYIINDTAEINVAFDDDDCLPMVNNNGFTLQFINDSFGAIENVAFIPSSTNPREIERIWVFRCSNIQFQSR